MSEKDKTIEEWRDIKGYEGLYQVSNFGRVCSLNRIGCHGAYLKGKILKPTPDKDKYLMVGLYKNRIEKKSKVHRLVAQAFISNPKDLPEVNHKDENKQNNNVSNLEWCDHQYNNSYGTKVARAMAHIDLKLRTSHHNYKAIARKLSKSVISIDKLGNEQRFESIKQAGEKLGISASAISSVSKGKYKTVHGYTFRYAYLLSDHRKVSQ